MIAPAFVSCSSESCTLKDVPLRFKTSFYSLIRYWYWDRLGVLSKDIRCTKIWDHLKSFVASLIDLANRSVRRLALRTNPSISLQCKVVGCVLAVLFLYCEVLLWNYTVCVCCTNINRFIFDGIHFRIMCSTYFQ